MGISQKAGVMCFLELCSFGMNGREEQQSEPLERRRQQIFTSAHSMTASR